MSSPHFRKSPQALQGIPALVFQQFTDNPFPGAMYGNIRSWRRSRSNSDNKPKSRNCPFASNILRARSVAVLVHLINFQFCSSALVCFFCQTTFTLDMFFFSSPTFP
ncbi:hypothetical protein JHK82_047542 [Glycine max]|uniref:Uncharacterized protein n=2 Tax=Glycine subgen. Soja TaxID=1462606 RepID=A0A0R0FDQ7_SOYBN|nr:hypothetical protein JHK86_047433 [Glycine max]RZB56938.1 hypothetical protein D0Y65_045862 [Glycine soja]KAG4943376.1 hypothetical protein JHK85_048022 [Glycine max]KAG5097688.1 hypothetical protein JHK82_047542 [Glycine max]KAG5102485.1 hypothetical protein JHK84_047454 [Glycine max]